MKLGGDTAAIGVGLGGGQALAKLNNFLLAGSPPPDLGASTGCGHSYSYSGFELDQNLGRFQPSCAFYSI
jgi:hypothetical protein